MAKPPISAFPPLLFLSPPSPNPNVDTKISPSILLIIIILAIIFFVSGLIHLLVRCLLRPTTRIRDPDPDPTALQGQLRQLFNLHDGGVDQSFIDTLPVFAYKAILGVKDPFDCAVCLCEFEFEDKLRLLPKCSHAFHVHCIDTWLLSHSTCPLCRFSLLHGFNGVGVPFVCVLESSRDLGESIAGPDSEELGLGFGSGRASEQGDRIVSVKLGKFRNVDGGEEGSSADINDHNYDNSHNLVSRRCYSMGSFAYVLDEKTSLHVPIRTPAKKKRTLSLKPSTMSEYGSDSMRKFQLHSYTSERRSKRESFSISRIWMRGDKGVQKGNDSSRRTISDIDIDHSFAEEETKSCYKRESFSISRIWEKGIRKENHTDSCRRAISEIEIDQSELGGQLSQRFGGEETQSCSSVDSLVNPTFSTTTSTSNNRTLLWLMGRHNKLLHNNSLSNFSSNV